jgi:hypothetical protein
MTPEDRAPEYDQGGHHRSSPNHPVLNETESRQAVPVGHMRYVLAISLVLVIVAFAVIYSYFFQGD